MLDALEVSRNVVDLPTLLRADFFPLFPAAGTSALFGAEFVNLGDGRQMFELRQVPPARTPLHHTQFVFRFTRCRGLALRSRRILRAQWLLRQLLAEIKQRLQQLALAQPVRARPVGPLAVARQLHLQTQFFQIQFVGALGLLFCTLLLAVALGQHRAQQRFQ